MFNFINRLKGWLSKPATDDGSTQLRELCSNCHQMYPSKIPSDNRTNELTDNFAENFYETQAQLFTAEVAALKACSLEESRIFIITQPRESLINFLKSFDSRWGAIHPVSLAALIFQVPLKIPRQ